MSIPAYKTRVDWLWDSFTKALTRSQRRNQPFHLNEAFSRKMASWFPGMGFEYGMGEEGPFFTLTPQGDPCLRPLVEHCVKQAPRELEGCRLYSSRQPWAEEKIPLSNRKKISQRAVWVAFGKPREDGRVDLILNRNPLLFELQRHYGWEGVKKMLHFAIGEDMTTALVGDLSFAVPGNMQHSFPLTELAHQIRTELSIKVWPLPASRGDFYCPGGLEVPFRDDVQFGFSLELALINAFYESRGQWDPLKGTGAKFQFLTMLKSSLPPGCPVEDVLSSRCDLIGAAIGDSGMALGFAEGEDCCYVDLLVFESPRVILQKLRPLGLDDLGLRSFAS